MVKLFGLAIFLGAFALFTQTMAPLPSTMQTAFDEWLASEEEHLNEIVRKAGEAAHPAEKIVAEERGAPALNSASASNSVPVHTDAIDLPRLSLELGSIQARVYRLGDKATAIEGKRVLRLLSLMRDSQVFSLPQADASVMEESAAVIVRYRDITFLSRFPESTAREHVAVMTLLRLFQEYGSSGAIGAAESSPPTS